MRRREILRHISGRMPVRQGPSRLYTPWEVLGGLDVDELDPDGRSPDEKTPEGPYLAPHVKDQPD